MVDDPRALVVLNVGADLADRLGGAVRIEEVVLHLEVLAQGDENVAGLAQVRVGGKLEVVQRESNGQVEAIEGGLVDDDKGVLVTGEEAQVNVILGGRNQVAQLPDLRLEGGGVEKFHQVPVGWVGTKVLR